MSDPVVLPDLTVSGYRPQARTDGMQQFQSIKRVLAGEITEVVPAGCYVREANGEETVFRPYQDGMTARYTPVVGDFWVVYDGRYASVSPRRVFLDGYIPIEAPKSK